MRIILDGAVDVQRRSLRRRSLTPPPRDHRSIVKRVDGADVALRPDALRQADLPAQSIRVPEPSVTDLVEKLVDNVPWQVRQQPDCQPSRKCRVRDRSVIQQGANSPEP
jgi:hypothetical protein